MAHRSFKDSRGRLWEVWEVCPSSMERRMGRERRALPRPGMDRRQRPEMRIKASQGYASGWLAFSTHVERRRLTPIPDGWAEWPDEKIAELLTLATPAGRPRRLIE
jgi:hypothetical protein